MGKEELKIAGMKLMIEGGAQFASELNTAKQTSKMLTSELKLLEAGTTSAGKNGTEFLRAKTESLTAQLVNQEQKTKILKSALDDAATATEVDAKQVAKLENEVMKSQIAEEKLKVSLINVNSELGKATNSALQHGIAQKKMGEDAEKAGKQISGVGDNMTKFITAPALAAAAALAALAAKSIATADGIQKTADVTGLSTDRIQELTYAGKDLDVELEVMTKSMAKQIKSQKSAQDGTALTVDAYKKLGVEYKNSDGSLKDSETVYWDVIESLGNMTNETERDAIAMQLLGKSAQELNPLIKAGKDKLTELSEEAHKNGAVMSGESVAALDAFGDSIEKAKVSIGTAAGEITVKMMPTLDKLLPIVQDKVVPAIGEFAETVGDLIVGFDELDPTAKTIISTVAGIILVAGPAVSIIGKGITAVGTMNTVLGAHKIAMSSSAAATSGLAAAEGTATVAGAGLAATLGPILLIAAAVAGVGIAYTAITAESNELTKSVTDVTDAMNASNEAFRTSISDTDASAQSTKNMSDRLFVLEAVEKKSNAQKAEMKSLVSNLNSKVPDLSLAYDDQTDSLNKNKDAVDNLIDAKMNQLRMAAYESQITKGYEDQVKQTEMLADATERYNKALEKANEYTVNPIDAAKGDYELSEATIALAAVIEAADGTAESLKTAQDAYAELSQESIPYTDSILGTGQTFVDTAETITAAASTMTDEFKSQLEKAKESQQKFYDDMTQSTSDYYAELGGINDKGIEQDTLTAEEWAENRRQQIEDMETWRVGMVELSSKVPAEFLAYLAELGPGQTQLIQDLVNATPEELAEYLQVWIDGITEAEQVSSDLSSALVKAYGNPYATWFTLGQNSIDGLIDGMEANAPGAYTAAQEAAKGVANAYKKQNDQHSPSKVFEKIGGNDIEGLIVGYKGKEHALKTQSEKIAMIASGSMGVLPAVSLGTIATNHAMSGYSTSQSSVVNNSTTDASTVVSMAGAVFNVRSNTDIDNITNQLAAKVTASRKAVGDD